MIAHYAPIVIFMCVGLFIGLVATLAGRLIGPHRPDAEKNSAYECGFAAFEDSRIPFDVRYYLVAILFIIFDLETAFLFPWAVTTHHMSWFALIAMGIFLGLLTIGFIYEWHKGALEWE